MSKSERPFKSSKPMVTDPLDQMALIDPTKKVSVYRNLHNKCFSVKQGSKVVFHTKFIDLKNVTFRVNENARQRIIATKRKEVHAYVYGFVCWPEYAIENLREVYYNPYTTSKFMIINSNEPCESAEHCMMMMYRNRPVVAIP